MPGYQLKRMYPYTPLARVQLKWSSTTRQRTARILFSNVLQTNRDADRLLAVVRAADADLMLFVETDDWWRERLDALGDTHPTAVRVPLPNTYGMLLYARLPLEDVAGGAPRPAGHPLHPGPRAAALGRRRLAQLRAPPPAGARRERRARCRATPSSSSSGAACATRRSR